MMLFSMANTPMNIPELCKLSLYLIRDQRDSLCQLQINCCRNNANRSLVSWGALSATVAYYSAICVDLYCRSCSEGQFASSSQISCPSLGPLRRYDRFSIFQHGGRPPSLIWFTCNCTTHEEYLLVFVTVQNLVGIGAAVSIICQF